MPDQILNIELSKRLLIVDDDDIFRERLMRACKSRGFVVEGANCVEDGISKSQSFLPSHVLVDLKMPGASGLELVAALSQQNKQIKIVVLTGYGSIATALEAVSKGAFNYITKPADADKILSAFEKAPENSVKEINKVPSLEDVEWEHINRVVSDCNGNISKAAKLLGIHRRSLQRKLSKTS